MTGTRVSSMASNGSDVYYSVTASSLNKRPLGEIIEENQKKKGVKKGGLHPSTKKSFATITSKIDTGVKKS